MKLPSDRVNEFAKLLRGTPTDAHAEKVVRYMVEEVAKDCPIALLVRLGQCILDCRKEELENEVLDNGTDTREDPS